ncbi:hypothetical protein Q31a_07920 [Aureliella helgolandensis]|uniref:Uncharacterized protein n=1 Tax=Aureliella helgolandensis TaxID=2527968 RepID=A0A518G1N2_9BACT|nr:hypothetical protein Q31a_07920 [Aureliella helgolandensis]
MSPFGEGSQHTRFNPIRLRYPKVCHVNLAWRGAESECQHDVEKRSPLTPQLGQGRGLRLVEQMWFAPNNLNTILVGSERLSETNSERGFHSDQLTALSQS